MKSGLRAFLILLLVGMISLGSAAGATGYLAYRKIAPIVRDDDGPKHLGFWDLGSGYGTGSSFLVAVREKSDDGVDFSLRIPALLINVGLRFVSVSIPRETADEIQRFVPFLTTLAAEITRCPDGDFVEIVKHGETVRISKRGNRIVVHIDTDEIALGLAIPLSSFKTVIDKVAQTSSSNYA